MAPLRLETSFTAEEEFTDNAEQTRDNRKSQLGTRLGASLVGNVERARASLGLAYAPRVFLSRNAAGDAQFDQDLKLRAGWKHGPKTSLDLSNSLTDSHDSRDVGSVGTRYTGSRGFLRNQAQVQATYSPTFGRTALSYAHVLVRNYQTQADNSQSHIATASADWANPRSSVGVSYSMTRAEFDISSPYWEQALEGQARHAISPTVRGWVESALTYHDAERTQDFMLARLRPGVTLQTGPAGSMEFGMGVSVFAPHDSTTKVRPNALIVWNQSFANFTVRGRYEYQFQENYQNVDNTGLTETQSASLQVATSVLRKLTASLMAAWIENTFVQSTVSGGPAGTRDRTWSLTGETRYELLRNTYLTLAYIGTFRTSTEQSAEFYENRVRLGLTYQYRPY